VTVSVDERVSTPREAAQIADLSRATLLRRIQDGTIEATKHATHWRIAQSGLERHQDEMWRETVLALANDF